MCHGPEYYVNNILFTEKENIFLLKKIKSFAWCVEFISVMCYGPEYGVEKKTYLWCVKFISIICHGPEYSVAK